MLAFDLLWQLIEARSERFVLIPPRVWVKCFMESMFLVRWMTGHRKVERSILN